jgi:hypothetical protein
MAGAPSRNRISGAVAPWAQAATRRKRLTRLALEDKRAFRSWRTLVSGPPVQLPCLPVLRSAAELQHSEETTTSCSPAASAVAPERTGLRSSIVCSSCYSPRSQLARTTRRSSSPWFLRVARVMPAFPALPNPSLNLTHYGKRRKPGLQHMVHHCSPGLRRSPPWSG